MYIAFYQKIEPGQSVFDSPCGHILRYVQEYKPMEFKCPIRGEIFKFDKDVYENIVYHHSSHLYTSLTLVNLIEVAIDDDRPVMECNVCNRYWMLTISETKYKQQVMCLCEKISSRFPCESCHACMEDINK